MSRQGFSSTQFPGWKASSVTAWEDATTYTGPCRSVPDSRRGERYCRSCYVREGKLVSVEKCAGRLTREPSGDYHLCERTFEPPVRRHYHNEPRLTPKPYEWYRDMEG